MHNQSIENVKRKLDLRMKYEKVFKIKQDNLEKQDAFSISDFVIKFNTIFS